MSSRHLGRPWHLTAFLLLSWMLASERLAEAGDDGLGEDPETLALWHAIEQRKFVEARERAEPLRNDPERSFAAEFALGMALHYAEGDLLGSIRHLRRARLLFEARFGSSPSASSPRRWHKEALLELAWAAQDADRPRIQISALADHDERYEPDAAAQRAWPLMKLRRFDEARRWAERGLRSQDPWQHRIARTALCAIEFEAGSRTRSRDACRRAAEAVGEGAPDGGVELANAALGELQLFRFEEAERLLRAATQRMVEDYSNPWSTLSALLLREGRLAEAVAALGAAETYRSARPSHLVLEDQAELERQLAGIFLFVGRRREAAILAERVLDRPDRGGGQSSAPWQGLAGAAVIQSVAEREVAEMFSEERALAPWYKVPAFELARLRWRLAAWFSARRAVSWMASARRLDRTLRVGLPGGAAIPEPLIPELVDVLGPGVVAVATEEAQRREQLREVRGYLAAVRCEAQFRSGSLRAAMRSCRFALPALPRGEVLLRARLQAILSDLLWEGDRAEALTHLEAAWSRDPGVFRRLGLPLRVRFEDDGSAAARRAADLARRSPRFEAGGGFLLSFEARRACWSAPDGSGLGCTSALYGGDTEERGRALVRSLIQQLFTPKVDLAQVDLESLDGSTTSEDGRAVRRFQEVMDRLVEKSR